MLLKSNPPKQKEIIIIIIWLTLYSRKFSRIFRVTKVKPPKTKRNYNFHVTKSNPLKTKKNNYNYNFSEVVGWPFTVEIFLNIPCC